MTLDSNSHGRAGTFRYFFRRFARGKKLWGFSNGHVRFLGACRWSKSSQVKSEKKNWNWEGVPYLKDSWPSKGLRQTEIAGWTKKVLWSTILTLTKPIWSRITTLISEWLMEGRKFGKPVVIPVSVNTPFLEQDLPLCVPQPFIQTIHTSLRNYSSPNS